MNAATILALLGPLLPMIEQQLLNVEANDIQPWIKAQIAKETNATIVAFLTTLDGALDAAVKAGIVAL